MTSQDRIIQIKLTDDQKEQVRKATGKQADSLELSVQELEERIAPIAFGASELPSAE